MRYKTYIIMALAMAAIIAACTKTDEPADEPGRDTATRTLTHEDSVRLGIHITINGQWDGEDEYRFRPRTH